MNAFQNRIRVILALFIVYGIRRSYGTDKSSPSSSSSNNSADFVRLITNFVENLSSDQTRQLINLISKKDPSDRAMRDRYVSGWNSLNAAIDDFIREFEWQHSASVIRVDRKLKTTDWPIVSDDGFTNRFRLDFSYQTRYQEEVYSSVIFTMPELGYLHEKGLKLMIYEKEKYMFEKVLPMMYQSWPKDKQAPNFYASTPSGGLILENLNDGSHVVRNDLLDSVDECKLVFKALAQFHALSVARLDEVARSNLDSLTPINVLVDNMVMNYIAMEKTTKYSERMSRLLPANIRHEISSLNQNLKDIFEAAFSVMRRDAGEFAVLLQGSATRRNVFFELDEQTMSSSSPPPPRITRCKFFEFRFSYMGSPVLDLMEYFLTSVEFKMFTERSDLLFEFYLEELHKSLAALDHSCEYNLTMLKADLRRYKGLFIYTLISSVPSHWESNQTTPTTAEELIKVRLDVLKSKSFVSFFRKWMNLFSGWK